MKFLSQEEIEKLQIEEAHSDKKPKKLLSKFKLFTVLVKTFWSQHQLAQGKPLSWLNEFLTN